MIRKPDYLKPDYLKPDYLKPDYLVIGNPENRRVSLFQTALKEQGGSPARILSYQKLLVDPDAFTESLDQWQCQDRRADRLCIRLDSPGENAEVERLLIAMGLRESGRVARFKLEHGRIQHPRAWYAGFSHLLLQLADRIPARDVLRFASHPEDILLAFDKPRCHQYLHGRGIPMPETLVGISSCEQLIETMRERNWNRVFVKLATGSSASGVVALQCTESGMRALTSMEMVGSGQRAKFYNNLRLHLYTRASHVATIVNFLCREGAQIERWLPKAALVDRNFDLRLVTIGGEPMHCVVRTSRSPITNLHLGNRRGDLEMLRERMSPAAWSDVLQLARDVASAFPRSHMLGLDILLQPGFRRPTLLEVNAFGDLLPGVLFDKLDTYAAQIKCLGNSPQPRKKN